ncbi:MAG: hypothetical protein ABIA63_00330 [bacterium]
MEITKFIIEYIRSSIIISLGLAGALFLPIIISLFFLIILSALQEKRLWDIGGYRLVLSVAWIGTPIHELSHLLAAIIFRHRIKEIKLFKPDPKTGGLGYVTHSYDTGSLYQSVIGNFVIALAPFIGGIAVLYLLVKLLAPSFSLSGINVPVIHHLTIYNFLLPGSYVRFIQSSWDFFVYLSSHIFSYESLFSWKFYLFIYLIFSVSSYLAPSAHDFKLFLKPLIILLFISFIAVMATRPFTDISEWILLHYSSTGLKFLPLLYLAIFLNCAGCVLIHIVWGIKKALWG